MLVVDTGPLLAAADRSDSYHTACQELLETADGPLITTAMVIAEAAYLIDKKLGSAAEATLYESILDDILVVQDLDHEHWRRIRELVSTYADLHLGGTDASVVAVAERLHAPTIATLNTRHFRVVRPAHIAAFELLPELP